MIQRDLETPIRFLFSKYPIVTIVGPRQSGKTTLCRSLFPNLPYVNLESLDVREHAQKDPNSFLNQYPEGAIFDEIQRAPQLPSYLQVKVDSERKNGKYILTGSQNFAVRDTLSQSLAGRTGVLTLLPLSYNELKRTHPLENIDEMLFSGWYPRLFDQQIPPPSFYSDYFTTYVERDVRQLQLVKDLTTFQGFVRLCAGRIGQLINFEKLGDDAGTSQPTSRQWFSLLEASYIVFQLPPYFRNIRKRLVKSKKIYFYDVGLACYLLGIDSAKQLATHPLRGALFENLVVVEALKHCLNQGKQPNFSFYRDSDGKEIDLLWPQAHNILPIEIKAGKTISKDFFKSFSSFKKVHSEQPYGSLVVYGGAETQRRTDAVVIPLPEFTTIVDQLLNEIG